MEAMTLPGYDAWKLDNGSRVGQAEATPHYICKHPGCKVGAFDAPIGLATCYNCGKTFCEAHRTNTGIDMWCFDCGACDCCGRPSKVESELGLTCSPAKLVDGRLVCEAGA